MTIHEDYLQLVALTELHLLQEFPRKHRLMTDPETFAYFKHLAQQQPKVQPKEYSPPPVPPVSRLPVADVTPPPVPAAKLVEPTPQEKTAPPRTASPPKEKKMERIERSPPPESTTAPPLSDMHALMKSLFPAHSLIDEIPSDQKAKRPPSSVAQVIVLLGNEPPDQQLFLRQLAHAIDLWLAPAVIATVPPDSNVRILIGSPATLQAHDRECPQYALEELGSFLQDPSCKATLWQTLRSLL